MIKNYFKIAWRNATRNRVQALINLFGLTLGITCVMLIVLFIKNEYQYDRHFADAERIFRVNINGKMGEEEFYAGYTPPPVGKTLLANFPEIESYTRLYRPGQKIVRSAGDANQKARFNERGILGVDSNFLQVLTYPLRYGERNTCLSDPHSIVLTEATASKYFGNADPMGQALFIEGDEQPYIVTGVVTFPPVPSSLSFDFLIPISNAADVKYFDWSWVWLNVATYVKFKDHVPTDAAAVANLEAKFPAMVRQYAASAFDRIGQPYDEFLKKGGKWDFSLQPLLDIHLYSANIISEVADQGNIKTVYFFGIIALFILLLACVNFMNLSTAGASKRAKEIGVRKVVGSSRREVALQFFAEAFALSVLAFLMSLILIYMTIPHFNQLTGKMIAFGNLWSYGDWIYPVLLVFICTLLAGSYPAFYLSAFNPIAVLKGQKATAGSAGHSGARSGLIIFQFTISIALVICTLVVFQQLKYTQIHDLGLDEENVLVISNTERLGEQQNSFIAELKQLTSIKNASISSSLPGRGGHGDFYVPLPNAGDEPSVKDIMLVSYLTDIDFVETMDISLVAGRNFMDTYDDTRTVLINETAAKRIGYKKPIGKMIKYPGGNAAESYQIIGVMKDFHTESLHQPIQPFALFHESSQSYNTPYSTIAVRVSPGEISSVLEKINQLWQSFEPNIPFEYSFLKEELAQQYESDQRTAQIIGIFSVLAIAIACIGLLGLVIFATQLRTKEIGIRKVLGASISGIVTMLSKDFVRLVLVAIVIASPIAWWAMNKWLEDFAYRIDIQWWMFATAGLTAVVIALLTVSWQAIRAAVSNPVDSLREE
ncbi:ABC transporter permease [Parapedobacter indicus]|uniref:Putative ABC transport system permease protein n=1 Tax=Parapedobacter indicus TaxID=1477437 RepID=A0A1I3V945_9SPHI|nr:ABC transporter permease [Parapedobacter indicus]PPK98957.1 putative ABC transport system permease protein [Parapedobacter indicus]SFJ91815.1 putative ABC transport system permease protein [Parapedobacter indicus]